uniref:STAS domain-containing protein n=1 Tax=Sciurus vulgaris TaxID=55149 RepID=A0A8D2DYM0_SCIVU
MGLSDASGPKDAQALLSATQTVELQKQDCHVERPLMNQEQLEELGRWGSAPRTHHWRTWLRCSHARVAIMQLPQGLAYALLAGLPPVFGLCSSFYPVFIYFLFGTSRHISVGTFAVMSVMVGSVTESLAPDKDFLLDSNSTVNETARDATHVQLASTLSVLVGLFQVGLGLVHFGFVVTYLSEPLVCSYTTAASVQVFVSQLKYVFGLQLESHSGPLSLIYTVLEVCWKLSQSVIGTVVTAVVVGVVLVVVKLLNDKLQRYLPLLIPGELLTFGVGVVGNIPAGLVPPVTPNPQLFVKLVGNAFAIAVVGFAIAISLGKIFALRHGYRVDSNQELVAPGLTLYRKALGQQVAGAVSSLLILLIILKLGELFQDLPRAVLAATIVVKLKGMLMQFSDICSLWKANHVDLLIWLVTFVATILLNLDLGLAVAVGFSLLLVVVRTQQPHYSVLGQVSDTDIYRDVAEYSDAREVPGVKVFCSSATIYFANAELYSDTLKQRCGVDVEHLISQKKKLLKKQELKLKHLQKDKLPQEQATSSRDNSLSVNVNTSLGDIKSNDVEGFKTKARPENELEEVVVRGQEDVKALDVPTLKALGLPQLDSDSLILDLGALSFVVTVCIKSLKNIFRDFWEIEVEVYIASCHSPVVTQLEPGRFFDASITKQHLFVSVHDAVTFALQHSRSGPVSPVLATKL